MAFSHWPDMRETGCSSTKHQRTAFLLYCTTQSLSCCISLLLGGMRTAPGFSTSAAGSDQCDASGEMHFDVAGAIISELFQSQKQVKTLPSTFSQI